MAHYAFLFEADSIQRYILAGGKLKDMVAASEIVDRLCGEVLTGVLEVIGCPDYEKIPRRAGGAFYAIFDESDLDKVQRLQNLWSLMLPHYAPGLRFTQVIAEGDTAYQAIQEGRRLMQIHRNTISPKLPEIGPPVQLSPRTGDGAVCTRRLIDSDTPELLDENLQAKEKLRDDHRNVVEKFEPEGQRFEWPRDFDGHFPFIGDNRDIGLIHIDGNNLGIIIRTLEEIAENEPDAYIELFREFSEQLQKATKLAAQDATSKVLATKAIDLKKYQWPLIPARPLVLGGDDLTMIVRADLALDFTLAFIEAFEQHTEDVMSTVKKRIRRWDKQRSKQLPDHLTACGGICFIKSNQPFYMAHGLAESLCKLAKGKARAAIISVDKPTPSAISFHRVLSSLMEEADQMITQEFTFSHESKPSDNELSDGESSDGESSNKEETYRTTLGAYAVGKVAADPQRLSRFDDVKSVSRALIDGELNYSGLRHIATVLPDDLPEAERLYQRWCENMSAQQRHKQLDTYQQALNNLLGTTVHLKLPFARISDNEENVNWQSPLGDLLTLHHLERLELSRLALESKNRHQGG